MQEDDEDDEYFSKLGPPGWLELKPDQPVKALILPGNRVRVIQATNFKYYQPIKIPDEAVDGWLSVKDGKWHFIYDMPVENPGPDLDISGPEYHYVSTSSVSLTKLSEDPKEFRPQLMREFQYDHVTVDSRVRPFLDELTKQLKPTVCQEFCDMVRMRREAGKDAGGPAKKQ